EQRDDVEGVRAERQRRRARGEKTRRRRKLARVAERALRRIDADDARAQRRVRRESRVAAADVEEARGRDAERIVGTGEAGEAEHQLRPQLVLALVVRTLTPV